MDDMYMYEPPLSLWELVEQYVPEGERDEVKNMLGESMVDQSLELHLEVNTLLEIWRDMRDESSKITYSNRLPDPPEVRELLRKEIMIFVENIREKAAKQGRDPSKALSNYNQDVIQFACDTSRSTSTSSSGVWSRPTTARSSNGRETPVRYTPSSDRVSSLSSVSDDVDAMHEKLNILHLDEVTQHLRSYIEQEVGQLMRDIEFLQECLEREADFRDNSGLITEREPTLTELKEERQKLRKDSILVSKPTPPALTKTPNLRPSNCLQAGNLKLRPAGQGSPTSSGRQAPLKASHEVATKMLEFPNQNLPQHVLGDRTLTERTDNVQNIANPKLVKVGSIPVTSRGHSPAPPASGRPSSASRFRRMVLECRDTS